MRNAWRRTAASVRWTVYAIIGGTAAILIAVMAAGTSSNIARMDPAAAPPAATLPSSCADLGTCSPPAEATTDPAPTADPSVFGLQPGEGITRSTDDSAGTVTVNAVRAQAAGEYDEPAGPGQRYLAANVTYTCTSGRCSYNPYDWSARQADGTSSDPEFLSVDGALSSGDLAAGNRVRGNVIFALPVNAHGTIVYAPSFAGDGASWVF